VSHPKSVVDTVCMTIALLALMMAVVVAAAVWIAYGWRAAAYTTLSSLACCFAALIIATAYERHRS